MAYKLTMEKYAALKSGGGPCVLMWEDVSLYVWAAIIKWWTLISPCSRGWKVKDEGNDSLPLAFLLSCPSWGRVKDSFFSWLFFFKISCVSISNACMSVYHICARCSWSQKRHSYEIACRCWVPLKEQSGSLTIDPPLLPLMAILIIVLTRFMGLYPYDTVFPQRPDPITIIQDRTEKFNISILGQCILSIASSHYRNWDVKLPNI